MAKLRSKTENTNSSTVLTDKTNIAINRVAKKVVKPTKKIVGKSLTAKKKSAIKSSGLRSKLVLSEEEENNENICSNLPINKDDHSFKKPVSSKLISITPHLNKDVHVANKERKKQANHDKSANILSKKIVSVSKRSKNTKISDKPKPVNSNSINISPNFYGFEDSDLEMEQSPCKTELSKFDCSKPYRLALYVRPSRTVRINPALAKKIQSLNPSLNLTNYSMLNNTSLKRTASDSILSPNRTQFKVPFASTPLPVKKPTVKLVQRKITDVIQVSPKRTRAANADRQFKSYFEKSLTSDEEASPPAKEVSRKRTIDDVPFSGSSDEIEESMIPAATFKKSRRSYIKKSKPLPEPVDEPPSDEVIKSIEKVKKKGKSKKAAREDEEFEKWSQSMNSMFSEVDQFEMSFG